METDSYVSVHHPFFRSYPTYEEWKRVYHDVHVFNFVGSYPTYEEWKP